jgi:hypothetical protein
VTLTPRDTPALFPHNYERLIPCSINFNRWHGYGIAGDCLRNAGTSDEGFRFRRHRLLEISSAIISVRRVR